VASLKSLERAAKAATTRIIAASLRNDARGERPDWRAREYRVLFLRHDRIGDMILSTGVLRAIATSSPTIRLDVLASPINAPVLRAAPYVNEVLVFDRHKPLSYPAAASQLRRRRYDAVIDCMITAPSTTTLLLMLASRARHRIGVRQGNDFAYTLAVPPRDSAVHMVDKLGALATAFGIEPAGVDLRPHITLTALEHEAGERAWSGDTAHAGVRRTRLLVNVSAGKAFRQWPDDRFVRVVSIARARGPLDVLFIGAPSEWARTERLARLSEARAARTPSVRDAFAIVAACDVVFTPDTSIGHAASAFGKPATVLFIRDMSRLWGPYETTGRAIESMTHDLEPISADDAARNLLPLLDAARASIG
jgi:ADP-heptose:LPS heptosyltransferase